MLILEKALTLDLAHRGLGVYDKMTRARREASSRPLSLVSRTFKLVQDGLSQLLTVVCCYISVWAVVLVLAAVPAFVAETRFVGKPSAYSLARPRNAGTELSRNPDRPRRLRQGGSASPTRDRCY